MTTTPDPPRTTLEQPLFSVKSLVARRAKERSGERGTVIGIDVNPPDARRRAAGPSGHRLEGRRGRHDVCSKRYTRTVRYADGLVFDRMNAMALVSMSTGPGELTESERQRVVAAIRDDRSELARAHTDEAGFTYETGTNVVLARA